MSTMQWKSLSMTLTLVGLLAVTLLVSPVAFGQQDIQVASEGSHSFNVAYFTEANTGIPTTQVHFVNPGSTGGFGDPRPNKIAGGDLCLNVYVFDAVQELEECCSCKISPNGMLALNVNVDLTGNTFSGGVVHRGDIKVVTSAGSGNPAELPEPITAAGTNSPVCTIESGPAVGLSSAATEYSPVGEVEGWISHVRANGTGTTPPFWVTETDFTNNTLSASELQKLQERCFSLIGAPSSGGLGSGHGKCSCGVEF